MDEARVERRLQQRLALRLRRLDVVAEKIVVPDLELPDAGLVGIRGLHLGDDAAALVAQARGLRRAAAIAPAPHEAAVALDQRQFVGERGGEITLERAAVSTESREVTRRSSGGRSPAAASSRATAAAASRPSRMAARSRGPPRSRLRRESERRKSGALASVPSQVFRVRLDASTRKSSESSRSLIASGLGQRAREPLGEEARPGRGDGQIDGREQGAVAHAAERPRQLEIGAGRRIDLEASAPRPPRRRRERRPRLELGALDIGERERGGGDLGRGRTRRSRRASRRHKTRTPGARPQIRRPPPAQAASGPRACRRRGAETPARRRPPALRRSRSARAGRSRRRGRLRRPRSA